MGLHLHLGELAENVDLDLDHVAKFAYKRGAEFGLAFFKVTEADSFETIKFRDSQPLAGGWNFDSTKPANIRPDPSELYIRLAQMHSRKGQLELSAFMQILAFD